MKNTFLITTIIALLVGGASFFIGTKYQEGKQSNFRRQFDGQIQGQFGQGQRMMGNGNRLGFRPVNGEIISADEKSITVKLADGSSKIVIFTDKTEINKAENAATADLKTGEKVAVFGTENSDGSVTAQNIQLNPIIRNLQDSNVPTGNQ